MGGVEWESLIATISPRSFLFFIVADVGAPGPEGSHRPLAVTYRQGRGHGPGRNIENEWGRVRQVVRDCARAVDVLTCPANRVAIEAELSLAAAEHRGRRCPEEPQRVQVPDLPQPSLTDRMFWHGRPPGDPEQTPPRQSPPWVDAGAIREFPFISSCLRVALNRLDDDGSGARLDDVQERPLATVFRDDALEYGAVVIDISDLDAVRYGIVGSKISYVAAVGAVFSGFGWDRVESMYDGPQPELYLDNSGARTPLSAGAYMAKFGFDEALDGVERLEKYCIVEPRALRYISPPSSTRSSDDSIPPLPVRDHDAAVEEAISALLRAETVDLEAHRDSLALPGFQGRLRERLLEDPDKMWRSGASAQLLRLAYAGRRHLDWAAYRKLSYEHVATTLDSAELGNAQALSICIDAMDDPPTPLLETLARHETIRDLCFLQGPSRANDDKSSDLFSQICTSPFASALLGSRNIFVTCAFSAPLRRAFWLRDPRTGARLDSPALRSAFPVQHMFVRKQFVPTEEVEEQDIRDYDEEEEEEEEGEEEEDTNVTFWPCHFFLGDTLLNSERFVSGFLQYCRWIIDDSPLISFAATTSTLSAPRTESSISPMPAENLAIPGRCSSLVPAPATADQSPAPNAECWPLFGPLEPGSWVVVVSHDWHTTRKIRKERRLYLSWGYPGDSLIGVPIVRYAFLRARRRITLPDDATADGLGLRLEELAGPDSVDVVGGVEAFLRETAPGVDDLLVRERVEETVGMLRARWQPGEWPNEDLPADMDLLTVLDDSAARAVFRDFLADAAHVRGNLVMALGARPDGPNWYPALAAIAPSLAPVPRDDAVFRSLDEKDAADGANPLGTQRRLTPPEVSYTGVPYKPTEEKSSSWIYGPPVIKQLRWRYHG
ncbi:hypothetical protein B0I37DRAFT_342539 [Chaetomium sp. MPI-CAGE-AT-0009]|nr:hypothetical protein B0I37DRAFT_342539 [Chaetomium sp. MPI-CAGE-AT-0009]